jgi:hypothetical protein
LDYPANDPVTGRHGDGSDFSHALCYQGYRSRQIFDIFDTSFQAKGLNPRERYVRVIAGQASYYDRDKFILDCPQPDGSRAYQHADVFAGAPYFGGELNPTGMTVDSIIAKLRDETIPQQITVMTENKKIASDRGLKCFAYEGGQHLVAYDHNAANVNLLTQVNRDPRMKDLYMQYLQGWKNADLGIMTLYLSTGRPSQWGYWGMLEYSGQTRTSAPKYDGTLTFIESLP